MRARKRETSTENEGTPFRARVAEFSELPKDVVMGMPVLTMVGQSELSLENYRGILEYTDTLVRIQTRVGQIKVIGKEIQVAYYTNDEMKIKGQIDRIEYHHP